MTRRTLAQTLACAAAAAALVAVGTTAPAAFAAEEDVPSAGSSPAAVDYEAPVAPTDEQLAAAGVTAGTVTITPGSGSYTLTVDALTLADGVDAAELAVGDNREHNGGTNYVAWQPIDASNEGAGYTVTVPAPAGDLTVTVSIGRTDATAGPLLTTIAETSVPVS